MKIQTLLGFVQNSKKDEEKRDEKNLAREKKKYESMSCLVVK